MCQRMCPLTVEEAEEVLDARRATGRARLNAGDEDFDPARDAWPGSLVPAYVPGEDGALATVSLIWGFESPRDGRPVFNTRLDTARAQLERGRGLWLDAISHGRCLVPVRAFYEGHMTERVPSERTGKPVRRQYRFRLPGARVFLSTAKILACFPTTLWARCPVLLLIQQGGVPLAAGASLAFGHGFELRALEFGHAHGDLV